MKLNIKRPLVIFDLETTGLNPLHDRIIEISAIKLTPDGQEQEYTKRLNPGIPIPPQSTAVHGITDEDVADQPHFADIAPTLDKYLEGCDLAGYNSNKFDIPLLIEEFKRADIKFDITDRYCVDVQNIYYAMEPRTLSAAYRYYCGKELTGAHQATNDTRATYEVLQQQLERYDTLPNDIEKLSRYGQTKHFDLAGRITRNDKGEPIFNFGKHKGKNVCDVFTTEPSYYKWMMQGEFNQDTKDVITRLYYKNIKKK